MSKWINFNTRKPNESGDYLVVLKETRQRYVLSYSVKHKAFNAFDELKTNNYEIPITHWMKLPPLPKE